MFKFISFREKLLDSYAIRLIVVWSMLFVTALNTNGIRAQTTGQVSGLVTDETGGTLPGVIVELDGASSAVSQTDPSGEYRFDEFPTGPATVTFRLLNFSTVRRDIDVGSDTRVDVVLVLGLTADIVVTGQRTFRNLAQLENPRENLVGIATSASVGAVTAEQLASRPIMRPGEVLETVPGFIASQHSGEGKANQYYLRGFNLDHGSDFATTIAGVPLNESSGAHAHGYSDANFLIPELVSGVQYTKGPYFAEHGDFSAAGSANINYANVLDQPLLSVSTGGQGWARVLAAASPEVGSGNLLVGLETSKNNGPWVLPDQMRKVNGVIRYSQGDQRNGVSVTGMAYTANWNATDQIPRRAVTGGMISRYGNVDPTDAGRTGRYALSVESLRSGVNRSTLLTGYVLHGRLNLFQNFTYFLENPVDGDQVEQEGRRIVYGGKAVHRRLGNMGQFPVESAIGLSFRRDAVGTVGLYNTIARLRSNTIRNDTVGQTAVGLFGQSEIEWSRYFRTQLGVRTDLYRYAVTAQRQLNSGTGSSGIVTPKVTAVFGPWQGTEFYANYGRGYHSNDPRAATTRVDPMSGDPVAGEDPLVPARGYEFGARTVAVPRLQSTLAWWHLSFDSELVFVGDAGIAEASRPSERNGVEWTNYLRFTDWFVGELDLSVASARFADLDPAGNYIPGALDRVIAAGVTVPRAQRVFGSLRLRHFGPRPLVEDNSVKSPPTTIWNGEFGVNLSDRADITFEGFNLLNSNVSDIDYFYTSRLQGEPLGGVDDIHFHPSLPRMARVMLNVRF
ncbi:MAG: TonB-dependent receptor [Acidobacteria bacterium]|nr:TonB-dependent receptor [Acidobacteriota bacterium]